MAKQGEGMERPELNETHQDGWVWLAEAEWAAWQAYIGALEAECKQYSNVLDFIGFLYDDLELGSKAWYMAKIARDREVPK